MAIANSADSGLKITILQFNPKVGDLQYNVQRLLQAIAQAIRVGSKLFVSAELAISGYSAGDLFLRPDFCQQCMAQLEQFKAIMGITMVIACPYYDGKRVFNSAFVIENGNILGRYDKMILPNYDVFEEKRQFTAGTKPLVFNCNNTKIGLIICEDVWYQKPTALAVEAGAEFICVINSSPFSMIKHGTRLAAVRQRTLKHQVPLLYVNQVGGQDSLVFDGASFMCSKDGELLLQMPAFQEQLQHVEYFHSSNTPETSEKLELYRPSVAYPTGEALLYAALVLSIRDYVERNGFAGIILGLSGGIDSALMLALAVDAIGKERVMAIMMPFIYTAEMSIEDASAMADTLDVRFEELPIEGIFAQYLNRINSNFAFTDNDELMEENLQARIRGSLLMALSNKYNYLLLSTSNKSEVATGYGTLYGDMAGGFAPLQDVLKTQVYALAHYRNSISPVIPERIITRAPSAELKPEQTDQDTLPPYDILDQIIVMLVEQKLSTREIIAQGFAADVVKKVALLLKRSEFKRHQAPFGPKVSFVPFTGGCHYPVVNFFDL